MTEARLEAIFTGAKKWREEFQALRPIVLGCGLREEMKWGQPCYTRDGRNIVLIHGFKGYCALLFFQGALLKDPNGLLVQQTHNVQAARQLRFAQLGEIRQLAPVIKAYVEEAMAVAASGATLVKKTTAEFPMPEELKAAFAHDPALQAAFARLTPGRQRGYLLHFSGAKQSATRAARIAKHAPRIVQGLGLDD